MGGINEEDVRLEVCDRIGRELSDATWAPSYERAKQKLRHIVTHFGDADGARNTVEYLAQLVIEAIQAEAMTRYFRALYEDKSKGADTNADPQGHTNIILQRGHESQAFRSVRA